MTQLSYVLSYIANVLTVTLCAAPAAALWRILRIRQLHKQGLVSSPWHEVGMIVFAAFCAALASQTIIARVWQLPSFRLINIIPLRVFYDTYTEAVIRGNFLPLMLNFVGNILIFSPLGFLVGLLFRKPSAGKIALVGFSVSLCAELFQLFSERCSDIDDLWLNTIGALSGYAIYLLFVHFFPRAVSAFRVREQP